MKTINIEALTQTEKSALIYAETCLVDYAGLLEGIRMNADDITAFDKFKELGLIDFGRIPFKAISSLIGSRKCTHWIEFTDEAWKLAHSIRRIRAEQCKYSSTNRKMLDDFLLNNKSV